MSVIDIILLVPLAYGLIHGLFRGFVKEIAAIVGIVCGLWAARRFTTVVAAWLQTVFNASEQLLTPVSYALIFVVVAVALNILAYFVEKILGFVALGWINRLAGMIFGVLKLGLIVSAVLVCFDAVNKQVGFVEQATVEQSVLYQPLLNVVPKCLPFFSLDELDNFEFSLK